MYKKKGYNKVNWKLYIVKIIWCGRNKSEKNNTNDYINNYGNRVLKYNEER